MLNFAEQTGSGAVIVVWSFLVRIFATNILNKRCCSKLKKYPLLFRKIAFLLFCNIFKDKSYINFNNVD